MKRYFIISCLVFAGITSYGQKDTQTAKEHNIKQFWLVVLKTGPKDKEITDTAERKKLFAGHFASMDRLYNEGILKVAGPFGKNDLSWRGLFILDCKTLEEAEGYVKTDPTIVAGIFIVDIIPWFGEPSGSFKPGKPTKE